MTTSTNRDSLLKLLTLLRPALSTQNYIPALQHFRFAEDWVTAFNDVSAISARCGVDIEGCVPGELMIRALSSFNADSVSLAEEKGGSLLLSSGRSKLKVPTLPLDKFPYEPPQGKAQEVDLTDGILEGIRRCLFGVGADPTHPAQMGVTLDADEDGRAVLFSTDNFTISRYQTKDKIRLPGDSPLILPTFFCDQLLALNKLYGDEELVLSVYAGALVATFGNKAYVMTRTIIDLEPLDFAKVIKKFVELDALRDSLKSIPPSFDAAFGRATLVLAGEDGKASEVSVGKGCIELTSRATAGEAEDDIDWDGKAMSKPFHINPALVMRGLKTCGSLAFYPRALVLADDSATFMHMITHSAAANKSAS